MLKLLTWILVVAVVAIGGFKVVKWMENPWYYAKKPAGTGITFTGDQEAVSRSDPNWGTRWRWVLLEAEEGTNYSMSFQSGKVCMTRLWSVKTRYVAVRLGPDDVTFFATRRTQGTKREVPLERVIGPMTQEEILEMLKERNINKDDVTWI